MSRSYGRYTKAGGPGKAPATAKPSEIQINLTERHTIEQLALELQRMTAILQERGIHGVEKLRLRLLPLDEEAQPVPVLDDEGRQIVLIDIPEKPKKLYRENEPGVGVFPSESGATPPDRVRSHQAAAGAPSRPSGNAPSRK